MKPEGVAIPKPTVAWSTSPQVHPPSTRTVPLVGSTVALRMSERSITSASSHTPRPAALCDPPRTARARSWARPNRTQATTSAASRHWAMAAGRLSIMAL